MNFHSQLHIFKNYQRSGLNVHSFTIKYLQLHMLALIAYSPSNNSEDTISLLHVHVQKRDKIQEMIHVCQKTGKLSKHHHSGALLYNSVVYYLIYVL